MNERRLATFLFCAGFLAIGLLSWFDVRWATSSVTLRLAWVMATISAFAGVALDLKHRREDKTLREG